MDKINQFDLSIIKWLQDNLRSNFMDFLMNLLTHLGDMYIFTLIVVIIYWAIDKRFAYKFAIAFIASAAVNAGLKNIFMRNRPFLEEGVTSISKETHGTSFPSGHSQASGVIYYSLNNEYGKNRYLKIFSYFVLIIVPFTRMYLGQHYLTDVLFGAIIGILVTIGMFKLFEIMKDKEHIYPLFAIPIFLVLMVILHNKGYSNAKDIFVAGGGYIGFTLGYAIEKLYVKHDVSTTILNRILKVVGGLVIVLGSYFLLKTVFPEQSLIFDSIRYFLIAIIASCLVPYLFTLVFKEKAMLNE